LDIGVNDELGAKAGITTKGLDDTRGEDLLGDFDALETAVWGEWAVYLLVSLGQR